jgi:hypothetical protein
MRENTAAELTALPTDGKTLLAYMSSRKCHMPDMVPLFR